MQVSAKVQQGIEMGVAGLEDTLDGYADKLLVTLREGVTKASDGLKSVHEQVQACVVCRHAY